MKILQSDLVNCWFSAPRKEYIGVDYCRLAEWFEEDSVESELADFALQRVVFWGSKELLRKTIESGANIYTKNGLCVDSQLRIPKREHSRLEEESPPDGLRSRGG